MEYNHLISLMVLSINLVEARIPTERHTGRLGVETLPRGIFAMNMRAKTLCQEAYCNEG